MPPMIPPQEFLQTQMPPSSTGWGPVVTDADKFEDPGRYGTLEADQWRAERARRDQAAQAANPVDREALPDFFRVIAGPDDEDKSFSDVKNSWFRNFAQAAKTHRNDDLASYVEFIKTTRGNNLVPRSFIIEQAKKYMPSKAKRELEALERMRGFKGYVGEVDALHKLYPDYDINPKTMDIMRRPKEPLEGFAKAKEQGDTTLRMAIEHFNAIDRGTGQFVLYNDGSANAPSYKVAPAPQAAYSATRPGMVHVETKDYPIIDTGSSPEAPAATPGATEKPLDYPDAQQMADPQGVPHWYIQRDGKWYKVGE